MRDYVVKNYGALKPQWRRSKEARSLDRDPVAVEYAAILRGDPCCYCGAPAEHIDHIEPKAAGGSNAWDNLTAACASCNKSKRATPLLAFLLRR